jgi:putative spermidine/putrescine transport system substrate-binding protein
MRPVKLLLIVLGSSLALTAAACSSGASSPTTSGAASLKGQTLSFVSWGGVFTQTTEKYLADPFSKATGVKVSFSINGEDTDTPVLLQEQSHNVSIDLIDGAFIGEINTKNAGQPFPQSLRSYLAARSGPGEVGYDWLGYADTAVLIACNPHIVKKCPTTPQEFFNVKAYPGPRAMPADAPDTIFFAEEAAGIPRSKLNPPNMTVAFNELKAIKPYVKVWTESGSQMQQVMLDGEVGIEFMWNGRAYVDHQQDPYFTESWTGATMELSGWMIPKGAPDLAAAYAFLKWVADHPKNQAEWTSALTYPTPTSQLSKLVSPAVAAYLPAGHNPYPYAGDWFYTHPTQVQNAWQSFLAG